MKEIDQLKKSKFYKEIDQNCLTAIEETKQDFQNVQWPPAHREIENLIAFKRQEIKAREACSHISIDTSRNDISKDTSSDDITGLIVLFVIYVVLFTANAIFVGLVIRQRYFR